MGILSPLKRVAHPLIKTKISPTGKMVEIYTQYFNKESVENKTILYESRDGKSLTDSPYAIFSYLLKKDIDKEFTHIWVIQPSEEMTYFMNRFKEISNVKFVERNSEDYLKWLVKAEYLVNNATFQSFVTIKNDQTYINTWHGTPLKTMGFDIPGNPSDVRNVVRNFFMADYLISPNRHTTNMFLDSYRLRSNYQGQILEGGYPRMDATFNKNHDDIIRTLHERKLTLDLGKKILLYTPTWKGGNVSYSENDIHQIISETTILREKYGNTYNILIKVHPFLYDQAVKEKSLVSYLIPDGIDANQLLAFTDVLITDYSSIFFDYLVTDKPIIFYCWDDDLYSNERGKYFEYDELPGPVAFTIEEVIDILNELPQKFEEMRWNYERFKRLYVPYEDGEVTKRYVEHIFYNQPLSDKVTLIEQPKNKTSLLIYPGGLRKNGITTSFLNMLSTIDYEKYAITCLLDNPKTQEQIDSIQSIPKDVSLLFNFGQPIYTFSESYQDLYYHIKGINPKKKDKFPLEIYKRDARRLLGKTTFDVSIDFSGYSLYWTKSILGTNSDKKVCYLHSDMLADMDREVNGKKVHKMNVKGVISAYSFYDSLVSVSKVICDINRKNLSDYAERSKFVYAENLLNIDAITSPKLSPVEENTHQTKRLFRDGCLKNPIETLEIYDTRPDSPFAKIFNKKLISEEVMVLGEFLYKEKQYVKISQNNSYIGWIRRNKLDILPDKVLTEEEIYQLSKLQVGKASALYSAPIGVDASIKKCDLDSFDELYVLLVKKAITHSSTSFLVSNGREELGWIDTKFVRPMPSVSMVHNKLAKKSLNSLLSKANEKSLARLTDRSLNYQKLNKYVKLTNQVQTFKEATLELSTGILLKDSHVILLEENTAKGWTKIQDESQQINYARTYELTYVNIDKPFVLSRKDCKYSAKTTKSEVNICASIEEVLNNRGLLSKIPSKLDVLEEIETNQHVTYCLVTIKDKKVWINKNAITYDLTKGILNNRGEFFAYPTTKEPKFVTVGRLSQEKNQALLIDGFKLYYEKHQTGHLYIIGDGPEKENLTKKIKELKLESVVTLTGQFDQPYSFMSQCDVFVLTSDYEGQSLVLLEALTLSMKVISTDIPACRNVLDNGKYGMLTKSNDAVGVSNAMEAILKKKKEFKQFKPMQYNRQAMEHFIKIISK